MASGLPYNDATYLALACARVLSPTRNTHMNSVYTSSLSIQHSTDCLQARICFLVRPQLLTRT